MSEYRIVTVECADLPGRNSCSKCRRCHCVRGYLVRYIKADASVSIRWACEQCEDYKSATDLPRSFLLPGVEVEDLPVIEDRSYEQRDMPRCAVCGNDGEDAHHWAPQAIFPDWPSTAVVVLCKPHHKMWHDRMREHGLRWPHELATST